MHRFLMGVLLVAWGIAQADCRSFGHSGGEAKYTIYGGAEPVWVSVMLGGRSAVAGVGWPVERQVALSHVSPVLVQCRHHAVPDLMARLLERPDQAEEILVAAGYEKMPSAGFVLGCQASEYHNGEGVSLVWLDRVGVPARLVHTGADAMQVWQLAELDGQQGDDWLASGASALNREGRPVGAWLASADGG